jgi:hypothetical protein
MIRFRIAFPLILLLFTAAAWPDELKTLAGKSLTGNLQKITDTDIVLDTKTTPIAQVLELNRSTIRPAPAAEKYVEVQLADESLVRCTKIAFGIKDTVLQLTTGASVKVPTAAVVTVLRDAQELKLKEQWTKLLKSKKRTDRIYILRDGDLNPVDGTLGAIDEAKQTVKFKPAIEGASEVESAFEKLQGVQFARTDVSAQDSLCKVYDLDGNLLVASKLAYDGTLLTVTTPYGQKAAFDGKLVARIDFNFGRLTYLSDLPAKAPESFLLGGFNPVRKDLNLDGNPIMLQDKPYPKGLSMYAGAELEYNLGEKYKKLSALLGVDSRIAEEGQGKVIVTIYCDREKRFTQEVSAKAAVPINLDVTDVKTLKIVVSGSNFTNYSGHATLANAHVSQ